VLFTIYRKLWWLSSPDLFRPWVFRIASRTAFRYLKRERRWPGHLRSDDALDDMPGGDQTPPSIDVERLLHDERVSPASRAVLALHFKEGMTLREVAAVLDLPLGTIKSRLAYGLAALRRHYVVKTETDDD
jgi:RNA polymerase sigma-70 factor, ECF subfamily